MNYYARLIEEKRNAQTGPKLFRVLTETFDISTVGGLNKASAAINRHHKEVIEKAARDLERAMDLYDKTKEDIDKWQAEIGHELLLKSRER